MIVNRVIEEIKREGERVKEIGIYKFQSVISIVKNFSEGDNVSLNMKDFLKEKLQVRYEEFRKIIEKVELKIKTRFKTQLKIILPNLRDDEIETIIMSDNAVNVMNIAIIQGGLEDEIRNYIVVYSVKHIDNSLDELLEMIRESKNQINPVMIQNIEVQNENVNPIQDERINIFGKCVFITVSCLFLISITVRPIVIYLSYF